MSRPAKPDPLPVTPENIPDELQDRDQWVSWRYQWMDDRDQWTKIPVDASTGRNASSTDASTWRGFATTLAYYEQKGTAGVGFVVSADADMIVGLDLDDCRDPQTGEIDEWALQIVDDVPTYWEVSPSGTGLRGFGLGIMPDGKTRADVGDSGGHMEMYETGRYLTVTGHRLDDVRESVNQVRDEIESVHAEYIADDADSAGEQAGLDDATPAPDGPKTTLDDAELVEKAKNAENGEKFARLWRGDASGYPSHSEARYAFAHQLAFWTGGDEGRMLRLFKQSDLIRDDDDIRTFENYEAPKAVNNVTEYYDPQKATDGGVSASVPEGVSTPSADSGPSDGTQTDDGTADSGSWEYVRSLYDADDTGEARFHAADVLAESHSWRNLQENDVLYWYDADDGTYSDCGEQTLRQIAREKLGSNYSTHELKQIKSQIRATCTLPQEDMGGPEGKIAVGNGVLDVSDRTLVDHSPEFNFLSRLRTDYDPDAECPRFDEFLQEVVPDKKDRKKLQEYAGYTLYHWGLPFAKALFIVGPQASGKSTFIDTLRAMHGGDRVASLSPQQMVQRFGGAELHGSWVNLRNDIPSKAVKNTGEFKEIVAGDPVKAEKKRKDPFFFNPTAKHVFAANQLPDAENDDAAFYRRILLTAFPNTVPKDERDPFLDEKLQSELPGVLNWSLDGLDRLMENGGFTGDLSPSLTAEKWDKWGHTADRFASTCLDIGDSSGDPIPKDDLYQTYQQFCRQENMPADMQQAVTRRLKTEHGAQDGKKYLNGQQRRVWTNISYTPRADAYRFTDDTDETAGGQTSL